MQRCPEPHGGGREGSTHSLMSAQRTLSRCSHGCGGRCPGGHTQWRAGILRLPRGAKGACLGLAVLLIALYAVLIGLNMAGTVVLARYALWLVDWPQIFLVPGFLVGLAVHKNALA